MLAHILAASLIALTAAGAAAGETGYVAAALLAAGILDLDRAVEAITARLQRRSPGRGGLAPLRGLLGLLGAGALAGLLFQADAVLGRVVFVAFAAHLALDWVTEPAVPLAPVDSTEIRFFPLSLRQQSGANIAMLAAGGTLWILYLAGAR